MRTRSIVSFLCAASLAWAHHSFTAEFDVNKPVHLVGTIARVEWTNPHIQIYLDVAGVRWSVEAASPNALSRRGLAKFMIPAGARVVIDGLRSKTAPLRATGREIVLPDGRRVVLDSHDALHP